MCICVWNGYDGDLDIIIIIYVIIIIIIIIIIIHYFVADVIENFCRRGRTKINEITNDRCQIFFAYM